MLITASPAAAAPRGVFDGDDDPVLMAEILNTVKAAVQDFPALSNTTVVTEPLASRIYALSGAGTIIINDAFTSDPNAIQRSIEYDVSIGFHPPLGHCSGAQYLAYHESAHLIDFSTGAQAKVQERFGDGAAIRDQLSGYSRAGNGINASEALAEAFAAVKCNGGNSAEQELNRILTS